MHTFLILSVKYVLNSSKSKRLKGALYFDIFFISSEGGEPI